MVVAVQLAALLALLLGLWRLAWRPHAVARSFERQGVRGPPYTFLAGSLPEAKRLLMAGRRGVPPLDAACHDIMPVLLPQFHRWVADYGRTFLFWIGPIPALFSADLQLIKQVLTDRTGLYQKDFMIPVLKFLFGNGVILINGDDWKRHRKVVLPAFNHETIKSMSAVTAEVTKQMMQQWREQMIHQSGDKEESAEIDMIHAFNDLTAKVNGRVAFGTSHRDVEEVIVLMREMQKLATAATLDAPILWYLPTRRNLHVRRLNKQLRSKIMSIMQARLAADGAKKCDGRAGAGGGDLLGLLLEAWTPQQQLHGNNGETLTTDEVIDECKTFFAAGQETTATLLVWAMFLLAVHPEWQDRVREEVVREFCTGDGDGDGEVPHADVLAKLKLLYMVLLETSRLYPPIVYIQRRAASDAVLGDIKVPQGTVISIPIAMLHRDKQVWGPDADEFNPMRFEHGLTKAAKDPKALLAFSLGPRVCTGQSFGIVEVQVVMAMILRRFSFSLSPEYTSCRRRPPPRPSTSSTSSPALAGRTQGISPVLEDEEASSSSPTLEDEEESSSSPAVAVLLIARPRRRKSELLLTRVGSHPCWRCYSSPSLEAKEANSDEMWVDPMKSVDEAVEEEAGHPVVAVDLARG